MFQIWVLRLELFCSATKFAPLPRGQCRRAWLFYYHQFPFIRIPKWKLKNQIRSGWCSRPAFLLVVFAFFKVILNLKTCWQARREVAIGSIDFSLIVAIETIDWLIEFSFIFICLPTLTIVDLCLCMLGSKHMVWLGFLSTDFFILFDTSNDWPVQLTQVTHMSERLFNSRRWGQHNHNTTTIMITPLTILYGTLTPIIVALLSEGKRHVKVFIFVTKKKSMFFECFSFFSQNCPVSTTNIFKNTHHHLRLGYLISEMPISF